MVVLHHVHAAEPDAWLWLWRCGAVRTTSPFACTHELEINFRNITRPKTCSTRQSKHRSTLDLWRNLWTIETELADHWSISFRSAELACNLITLLSQSSKMTRLVATIELRSQGNYGLYRQHSSAFCKLGVCSCQQNLAHFVN